MNEDEFEDVKFETNSNDGDQSTDSSGYSLEKRLIEEIKKRPFLYDYTLDDFKDHTQKDAAWEEISQTLGKSVQQCQCRWKSLRDRFVRQSRKMREGSGPKRHVWEMTKYLTFLDDIPRLHRGRIMGSKLKVKVKKSVNVTPKVTSTREVSPPKAQQVIADTSSCFVPLPQIVRSVSVVNGTPPSPIPELTLEVNEKPNSETQGRKQSQGRTNNSSNLMTTFVDMADGCSAFGMSVSATLRSLPLEQQELAKLKIQQVLYEVQFS